MNKTFFVVKIDHDASDTFADESMRTALEMAQIDRGSYVTWGLVEAPDAGAARIATNVTWHGIFQWADGLEESAKRAAAAVARLENRRKMEEAVEIVATAIAYGLKRDRILPTTKSLYTEEERQTWRAEWGLERAKNIVGMIQHLITGEEE